MSRRFLAALVIVGPALTALGQVPVPPPKADPAYVRWLEERSILTGAARQARAFSGHSEQWHHRYGDPRPRDVVRKASVWLLDYAGSVIPAPEKSVLATYADPARWQALRDLGIDLLHTGPIRRSGGVLGREFTPSTDGGFDPIGLDIDPQFGGEDEFRRLARVAGEHGGLIGGSLVPLHTGTGPDFRLAQLADRDYPGMYTMVEVRREDWPLLPKVNGPWATELVPNEAADALTEKGYIPGRIHSCDAAPQAKSWSGWSATGEVTGVDGRARRWVYLHYFKPSQPALNWLDPSFAAQRAVAGDAVTTVHDLGARVVRLDAVPFLGIERKPGDPISLNYQHPLSVVGTDTVAMLVRKLGGWSFQELNVPLKDLKPFTAHGPDLSYDFTTRAQVLHALLTGDAAPLRLALRQIHAAGAQPVAFVHDLQNHDEITYQLTELEGRKDETFDLGGRKITGGQLKERMLAEMRAKAAGDAAPHNRLYRPEQDGVATTFAAFAAAGLGIRDPYHATPEQREQIQQAHLLLAAANALQPGVFSLSAWDLVGALPVSEESVATHVKDGDYRWINRGAVDLMGANPGADKSVWGLPRAVALYGPLPEQLKDPQSFASRLKRLLAARREQRIAEGELVAVPEPRQAGVCLLVLKLPERHGVAVTALNFGRAAVEEDVNLAGIPGVPADSIRGRRLLDAVAGVGVGEVGETGRARVRLPALSGTVIVVPDR